MVFSSPLTFSSIVFLTDSTVVSIFSSVIFKLVDKSNIFSSTVLLVLSCSILLKVKSFDKLVISSLAKFKSFFALFNSSFASSNSLLWSAISFYRISILLTIHVPHQLI